MIWYICNKIWIMLLRFQKCSNKNKQEIEKELFCKVGEDIHDYSLYNKANNFDNMKLY